MDWRLWKKKSLVKHLWSPYESKHYPIFTITHSLRLRYLGVKIYSVCVLAGAELQARVDRMGGAGVISIIALIIVISISSRRQTHCCSPVCRETGRDRVISRWVFIIDSLLAFIALLVPVFAPLVMQWLAETLNADAFETYYTQDNIEKIERGMYMFWKKTKQPHM